MVSFMTSEKLVEFLKNQIALENSIVESVRESLEYMDNLAVKMALKGISIDSEKHAEMYGSAIYLLSASVPALDEEQLDAQRDLVRKHIAMEEELIKVLEDEIPNVENEKVAVLLGAILQDERRHHKLLNRLLEILVRGETVMEGDWWEAVWGDVPGLWT